MGTLLQALEDLVRVLLHLVLDVHLAALLVVLLSGQRVVQTEVIGVLGLDLLPVLVIQQRVGVGHAQEQPGQALEGRSSRRLLHKQTADESSTIRTNHQ